LVGCRSKHQQLWFCLFIEKIDLEERREAVERDPTCCGKVPFQAPQRRCSLSLVRGELQETNPHLSFVVCLICLISSIFTLLLLDLLRCACLWVQGSLPCFWSSTEGTLKTLVCARSQEKLWVVFCRFTMWRRSNRPLCARCTRGALTACASEAQVSGKKFYLVISPIHPPPPLSDI
jgi:hypothetical protein